MEITPKFKEWFLGRFQIERYHPNDINQSNGCIRFCFIYDRESKMEWSIRFLGDKSCIVTQVTDIHSEDIILIHLIYYLQDIVGGPELFYELMDGVVYGDNKTF